MVYAVASLSPTGGKDKGDTRRGEGRGYRTFIPLHDGAGRIQDRKHTNKLGRVGERERESHPHARGCRGADGEVCISRHPSRSAEKTRCWRGEETQESSLGGRVIRRSKSEEARKKRFEVFAFDEAVHRWWAAATTTTHTRSTAARACVCVCVFVLGALLSPPRGALLLAVSWPRRGGRGGGGGGASAWPRTRPRVPAAQSAPLRQKHKNTAEKKDGQTGKEPRTQRKEERKARGGVRGCLTARVCVCACIVLCVCACAACGVVGGRRRAGQRGTGESPTPLPVPYAHTYTPTRTHTPRDTPEPSEAHHHHHYHTRMCITWEGGTTCAPRPRRPHHSFEGEGREAECAWASRRR